MGITLELQYESIFAALFIFARDFDYAYNQQPITFFSKHVYPRREGGGGQDFPLSDNFVQK